MEKARPSENFGKASAIREKRAQVGGDVVDALAGVEVKAQRRVAAGERVALGEPALLAHDHGGIRQGLPVHRAHPRIAPEGAVAPDRAGRIARVADARGRRGGGAFSSSLHSLRRQWIPTQSRAYGTARVSDARMRLHDLTGKFIREGTGMHGVHP